MNSQNVSVNGQEEGTLQEAQLTVDDIVPVDAVPPNAVKKQTRGKLGGLFRTLSLAALVGAGAIGQKAEAGELNRSPAAAAEAKSDTRDWLQEKGIDFEALQKEHPLLKSKEALNLILNEFIGFQTNETREEYIARKNKLESVWPEWTPSFRDTHLEGERFMLFRTKEPVILRNENTGKRYKAYKYYGCAMANHVKDVPEDIWLAIDAGEARSPEEQKQVAAAFIYIYMTDPKEPSTDTLTSNE
jgi:hypothetical protein